MKRRPRTSQLAGSSPTVAVVVTGVGAPVVAVVVVVVVVAVAVTGAMTAVTGGNVGKRTNRRDLRTRSPVMRRMLGMSLSQLNTLRT